MKLPTRTHGMLDYALGVLLAALPWIAGFAHGGAESWVCVVLGLGMVGYSLLTDYELGVVRRIGMPVHLLLDAVGGALLAASPWIFGFDTAVWVPHVVVGLLAIALAAVTNTIPSYERRRRAAG